MGLYVPGGQASYPNRTFGGDNRSWATPTFSTPWDTPNYRTMLFANVNWDNPAPYDVIIQGGIGPTKLYDNGTLIETRTATFDDTATLECIARVYRRDLRARGAP